VAWLERIAVIIIEALLGWLAKQAEKPSTAQNAGRRNDLANRIRRRVHEYEDRVRRARGANQDRP